jgi:formyltetrahydrofolate deformylase
VTDTLEPMSPSATLLITCPDRPGLVAAVAGFLADRSANIVHADQHVDRPEALFLQRIEFETTELDLDQLASEFRPLADQLGMTWSLRRSDALPRAAILVSRQGHCLVDLLARWQMDELPGAPVFVASNHGDHQAIVSYFGIPYHHLPVTPDTRVEQEARVVGLLTEHAVDLIILARYMQVLSPAVVDRYPGRIINIHHSFLPAFAGGRPYHQAYERGVKVIGATAHYVTPALDEGPIIDQDVIRVSHRDEVVDLVQKGRDLEKTVLARAVRLHLEHRVLVYRNRTVVFD